MNQQDVLNAMATMEATFRQYLRDVPEEQRLDERATIQAQLRGFLLNSFTLLPPSDRPSAPPNNPPGGSQTCPACGGKGKI